MFETQLNVLVKKFVDLERLLSASNANQLGNASLVCEQLRSTTYELRAIGRTLIVLMADNKTQLEKQERTNELLERCSQQNEYVINAIKATESTRMKYDILIDLDYQEFLTQNRMKALYNEWKASGDTNNE